MALHVFPPSVTQPRKSSLKKPKATFDPSATTTELKGVAFEVNSAPTAPGVVQPGNQHIRHALFNEAPASQPKPSHLGSLKRQLRASTASSAASDSTFIRCDSPVDGEEDRLSPLPENNTYGSPSSQTRLAPGTERAAIPLHISTDARPDTNSAISPGGDRLSPLPERDRFTPSSARSEYPATKSLRSTSPTLVYGDSPASAVPPYSPRDPAQPRSMFPRWDPTKPLNEQHYYPDARSPTPTRPLRKTSKAASPQEKKPKHSLPPLDLQHIEPTATVVVGYEHIPVANGSDLLEAWNASCDKLQASGRKALFRVSQPRGQGTALGVGVSADSMLWTMKKDTTSKAPEDSESPQPRRLVVSKQPPGNPTVLEVAQIVLPSPVTDDDDEMDPVGIFPHMAAIQAIEAVADSAAASEIARVDPSAQSPAAARLAQDAVREARHRCQSHLVCRGRRRDSLGAVTAAYQLEHPTLGIFAVTVTKSTAGRHSRDPRAKISLHHPSATPAAISAETLVLAFLDFARDACVLDIPGLLALQGPYIVDTVICTLLAVAVIENDALMVQTMTFAAPPKSPLPLVKRNSRINPTSTDNASADNASPKSKRSGTLFKRNKKKKKEDDLPILTQGALALLGLSFKMAVWTLEIGVKATAGVIIGTSHIVAKA